MNYNEKYPIINCNSLKIPYQLYIKLIINVKKLFLWIIIKLILFFCGYLFVFLLNIAPKSDNILNTCW